MNREEGILARFNSDTEGHELEVLRDDGVYRHLSYGKPGSSMMRVDIVTWPGYLAYTGDMGAFVFCRTNDMLAFFRGRRINPSYWSEKVQAAGRDGVTEWSVDLFEDIARADFDRCFQDDDERENAHEAFEEEVIHGLHDKAKEIAYQDAIEFEYDGQMPFQDFWEVNTDIFTHRFLWCCHALVRIIELYDEMKDRSLPEAWADYKRGQK